jgi:glycosyltransferase involved in cell wall biosynthesis
MEIVDFLIVGSGCTAAMAAETLCLSEQRILMIDVGLESDNQLFSENNFIQKRQNDPLQSDYFLGKNFEALSDSLHPNIPQQTAQRKFMSALTDSLTPIETDNFFPVESLALGGLGNGWGLGSYTFSENELGKTSLPINEMQKAYQVVASRIGISGEKNDDASRFCHDNLIELQEPIALNPAAKNLYARYLQKRAKFNNKNIFIGRPSMALLTTPKPPERGAYSYQDLDFYENENNAAYRPSITIKTLIKNGKLAYKSGFLAIKFEEKDEFTSLECINIHTKEKVFFYAKKLILAASTLNTARIVLRSFESSQKLPILCNAYTYMPMIYLPFLGRENMGQLSGLAQLAMFFDATQSHESVAMASIYNYRSLLNFRILKQMPLNHADGMKFLKIMLPALFVAGIFHPADYQKQNYIAIKPADSLTGDCLKTHYTYENEEAEMIKKTEKAYSKAFFDLKCIILKKVRTLTGGSIHYAGTLPFSDSEKLFHLSPDGKLYGTKQVFVADGSGFKFLSGKGLTLSLMANAHRVAKKMLEND